MARSKSIREEVVRAAGELEQMLEARGARGRGLTEKTHSLLGHLPQGLVRDLEFIAACRNDAVHDEAATLPDLSEVRRVAARAKDALEKVEARRQTTTLTQWQRRLPLLQGEATLVWFAVFAGLFYAVSLGVDALVPRLQGAEWRAPESLGLVLRGAGALLFGYFAFIVARNLLIAVEDGLTGRVTLHQSAAIAVAFLLVPFAAFGTPGALEAYQGVWPFALAGTALWAGFAWWRARRGR